MSGLPGQSSYFCSVVEERRQIHVLTHALAQALYAPRGGGRHLAHEQ